MWPVVQLPESSNKQDGDSDDEDSENPILEL